MSYILDALKKSDQQRQRGATPTLPSAHATVIAPRRNTPMHYALFAAVLLCAGIAIGWWQPWQTQQAVSPPVAAKPVSPEAAAPATQPVQMQTTALPQHQSTAPISDVATPVTPAKESASPAMVEREQQAVPMSDLPMAIQQELPPMTVQLHSYSSNHANSIVSINSRMLKEGDAVAPGLRLEQITADGMVFSYKGYRFQRGIR